MGIACSMLLSLVILLAILRAGWALIRRRWRRELTDGECILVTGCDSGFGFIIARAIASHTKATVFAGRVTDEGAQRLRKLGARVEVLQLDVTKDADVDMAVKAVESSGKALCGVINNAGIGCYGWCEALPMKTFEDIISINLIGAIRVTKAFLPFLRRSRGRLITMGSLGARMPSAFGSPYLPTKAAIASFQDCVRQEVLRFGVRCSLIEPGFFATGMYGRAA